MRLAERNTSALRNWCLRRDIHTFRTKARTKTFDSPIITIGPKFLMDNKSRALISVLRFVLRELIRSPHLDLGLGLSELLAGWEEEVLICRSGFWNREFLECIRKG